MTSRHHVSELVAIHGTKSRPKLRPKSQPESGPSWDQVIFKSPTQLSTQLHTISSSQYVIKSVIKQVTENVFATNHREHRGHRDIEDENSNLQIHQKPCDELTTQQMIDTIRYPVGSELNTCFNPQSGHIIGYNRG